MWSYKNKIKIISPVRFELIVLLVNLVRLCKGHVVLDLLMICDLLIIHSDNRQLACLWEACVFEAELSCGCSECPAYTVRWGQNKSRATHTISHHDRCIVSLVQHRPDIWLLRPACLLGLALVGLICKSQCLKCISFTTYSFTSLCVWCTITLPGFKAFKISLCVNHAIAAM